MAIDDNTQYSLSGAQVKDIAARINSGAVKILTTSDYNYPTATPDCIWPGLLSDGVYSFASGVSVKWTTGNYYFTDGGLLIVGPSPTSSFAKRVFAMTKSSLRNVIAVNDFDSAGYSIQYIVETIPENNLTTTASYMPLAASQGKVLNDKIEGRVKTLNAAPSTSTQGTKGQLLEDTSNGKLYICTDATNPYVWEEVGGNVGPTVVQSIGNSTTDVMSQKAVSDEIFYNTGNTYTREKIRIGHTNSVGYQSISIGYNQNFGNLASSVAIGANSRASNDGVVIVGNNAAASKAGAVAIGYGSSATTKGEMNIGTSNTQYGYNSTNYRLLSGVYDPQNSHDAATKGYVDAQTSSTVQTNAGAPTTSTVGTVGQLLEDTTNGKLYICTAVTGDGGDPEVFTYTWEEVEAGGSGLITLSYGNSTWQDFLDAYNAGKIVYCRASSNSNPATGTQGRMAFMAYINNPTTPTEVEFQYVRSVSSKTAAQPCDQVFVYKLTNVSGGTWTVESRNMTYKVAAGTNVTTSYSNGTVTINADAPVITMTSTDPGEGGSLAANNFIAVYDAN